MGIFSKTARFVLIYFLALITMTFFIDFVFIIFNLEHVNTDSFMVGQFITMMQADPTELAKGSKDSSKLYTDEAIYNELRSYGESTYGRMSVTEKPTELKQGGTLFLRYKIDKFGLRYVTIGGRPILTGGVKGVEVTVIYEFEPTVNHVVPFKGATTLGNYPISTQKRFRIGY